MNKKFVTESADIVSTQEDLTNMFPQLKRVSIKVDRSCNKSFRSTIIAQVPKRGQIVAKKKSESYSGSLERSKKAIIKQLSKYKNKPVGDLEQVLIEV